MMSRGLSALWLLSAAIAAPAQAQPAPFDMSGERPVQPAPPPQPAPPLTIPAPSSSPPNPIDSQQDAAPIARSPAVALPAASATSGWRRHLIAGPELALSGEIDRRRWSIYLTREEAEAAATLNVAYQNAILVAPEASRLRVLVNETPVIDAAVASSDDVDDLSAAVPAGLLRPGYNTVAVEATLRHRTDCTVSSTYDLWTTLESARTFLAFSGRPTDFAPRRLEDLRATGLDADGLTQIRLALPAGDLGDASQAVLRVSQGLALVTAMPNQSIEIVQGALPDAKPGTLDVVLAPTDAVGSLLPSAGTIPGGGMGFLRRADGSSVLAVTGPGWDGVEAAAERIISSVDREGAAPRSAILNPALRSPDAPLMRQGGTLGFRDLGFVSQEFTGRHFRTEFAIAVPGDFFAEAYGEATLRLDAAYSGDVLPGSLINVYVNGNIATTLPVGGGGSGTLDRFPLRMTMRHLRPGVNTIALEANLLTAADDVCAPGTSTGGPPRFALFDTSSLEVSDFARIARIPDLAALQGVGFPYNVVTAPMNVVLPDDRAEGLGAAADLLGRIAFAAGHAIPVQVVQTPEGPSAQVLFVGSPRQLTAAVLARANIDPSGAAQWSGQAPTPPTGPALSLESWRQQFGATSGWRTKLSDLGDWLRSTFDIEAGGLRLLPTDQPPLTPQDGDGLVVGQGPGPQGGTWTVVTAPNASALKSNIALLVREANWVQLTGRVSALNPTTGTVTSQAVGAVDFVQTQPLSFANIRLILANWLSENVLAYASVIVAVALLLGIATTAFVQTLGHRE